MSNFRGVDFTQYNTPKNILTELYELLVNHGVDCDDAEYDFEFLDHLLCRYNELKETAK